MHFQRILINMSRSEGRFCDGLFLNHEGDSVAPSAPFPITWRSSLELHVENRETRRKAHLHQSVLSGGDASGEWRCLCRVFINPGVESKIQNPKSLTQKSLVVSKYSLHSLKSSIPGRGPVFRTAQAVLSKLRQTVVVSLITASTFRPLRPKCFVFSY